MKKFGKILLIIVAVIIVAVIVFVNAPVQVHRMFGGYNKVDRNFYPQWINNEEYCYLRVENYYIPVNIWPSPMQMLDGMLRGNNATFYIYKVNINEPDKKELLKEIDLKVNFDIGPSDILKPNIDRTKFNFRRLDNGKMFLIINDHVNQYIAYYLNAKSRIVGKKRFGYAFWDGDSIVDVSPDGKNFLTYHNGLYVKDVDSGKKVLISDRNDKYAGVTRWIGDNELIIYRDYSPDKENWWDDVVCEVYLADEKKENVHLVFSGVFKKYDELRPLMLETTISTNKKRVFLSKIGIFEKLNNAWQMIKDLKDMKFNFFYPDWSPDGKYLVGVTDEDKLKLIKYEDLLQ